jgi:hypothetical protein
LSRFGGMVGSAAWVITLYSIDPDGSPLAAITPLSLPAIAPWYVVRSSPAFFLSGLWQLLQALRNTGSTWSANVTLSAGVWAEAADGATAAANSAAAHGAASARMIRVSINAVL